jgi:hypothetical protein
MKKIINKFINSDYCIRFRRIYILSLMGYIKSGLEINPDKNYYICLIKTRQSKWICWKDLKEVRENLNSEFIREPIRMSGRFTCDNSWFSSNSDRLSFLNQCLDKLNKNGENR